MSAVFIAPGTQIPEEPNNFATATMYLPSSNIVATACLTTINLNTTQNISTANANIYYYSPGGPEPGDPPFYRPVFVGNEITSITFGLSSGAGVYYAEAAFTAIDVPIANPASRSTPSRVVYDSVTGQIVHIHHTTVVPGAAAPSKKEIDAYAMRLATTATKRNAAELSSISVDRSTMLHGHRYKVDISKKQLHAHPLS
jgi:hypothetical protein